MNFFKHFLLLGEINYCKFLLENLNILKSWEQIKGANKPVKKTSAKIFFKPVINIKELVYEKFPNKICKKLIVPHRKLPKEQIKPYLKCPTKISLCNLILPNKNPQKIKPGIWVKLLSKVRESKIRPKNKPNINPFIEPLIIDQGNNQNNGQYGWAPKNPSQLGCHKKIIGIKIKLIMENLFIKNLCIKDLLSQFAPNQ